MSLDDPLPWLLVTARYTVANTRRRAARSEPASDRLADIAAPGVDGPTEREREAVLLVAWDGLDVHGAARVAGCSPRAFTVPLHRARERLRRALDPAPARTPSRLRLAEETS